MTSNSTTWTKTLVQEHAQTAVAVELYTLPFYLTVLSSIKDPKNTKDGSQGIYNAILSVCIEEMLHLQLAANLCLALDTKPNFTAPKYGVPIPYLKPNDLTTGHNTLINAVFGPLNDATIQMMLDIETPTEFEEKDHTTPQYPYYTLGDMYNALLAGIETVGKDKFSWDTTHQQVIFTYGPKYDLNAVTISQTIGNIEQAKDAINLINEQGEGQPKTNPPQPPYQEKDFNVAEEYRFVTYKNKDGQTTDSEANDPSSLNRYSHFGRFVWVQNQVKANGYPAVYSVQQTPELLDNVEVATAYTLLVAGFNDLLHTLNIMWNTGQQSDFWSIMPQLTNLPKNCWEAGVVPKWSL